MRKPRYFPEDISILADDFDCNTRAIPLLMWGFQSQGGLSRRLIGDVEIDAV